MNAAAESRRVLVCGASSFVGKNLVGRLREAGHVVTRFGRGAIGKTVGADGVVSITGPVDQMPANHVLTDAGPFDTLINFILLKDELVEPNQVFMQSLLTYCLERGVKHLIHISSCSVYAGDLRDANETSPVETDVTRKGPYAALKVAQDRFLLEKMPSIDKLNVTFVRPGFVLGPGLLDPIVGMAARLPWNKLLILGDAKNSLPVISRDLVDASLVQIVGHPPTQQGEVYILVDPQSPSRKVWLDECCRSLGVGRGTIGVPRFMWSMLAFGAGIAAKLARMKRNPGRIIRNALRVQWFNSKETEKKLAMSLQSDWRQALVNSMEAQQTNFQIPYPPIQWHPTAAKKITFLGYGGIVKQKHLPALKWIGFTGEIEAFDLRAGVDEKTGQKIIALDDTPLPASDLYVVATPGRAHIHAIKVLEKAPPATVMIEKPLCYSRDELARWIAFADGRSHPVLACHNYRFKKNVAQMLEHLRKFNPGKLLHVDLLYQSPPVGKHYPAWRRAEREAQTLLMEYSLHYIDVACMFHSGTWDLSQIRHSLNPAGETSVIQGLLSSEAYTVSFICRQAISPRRAKLLFTFQNYNIDLGFFPDTFVPYMAPDSPLLYTLEQNASAMSTGRKILDKLTKKDSDQSHPAAYMAATDPSQNLSKAVELKHLQNFYDLVFRIADAVYGGKS
jgi:nucleoside-diphosphate-sugar epimerase